ncbi:MAG TPA: hypothetical protein VM287_02120 [Egibacteraceae bacterium]|nr:hypothetical protein [Egibacteraceae bacterium]
MRRSVRAHSTVNAGERLTRAIAGLPPQAQRALARVAEREDLPLVAGVWHRDNGGCLVANVVGTLGADVGTEQHTLDLRILELIPELSSRDLNRLIVAWDEAALQEARTDDAGLRRLLRAALAGAGVTPTPQRMAGAAPSSTSMVRSSVPLMTVSSTSSPGE